MAFLFGKKKGTHGVREGTPTGSNSTITPSGSVNSSLNNLSPENPNGSPNVRSPANQGAPGRTHQSQLSDPKATGPQHAKVGSGGGSGGVSTQKTQSPSQSMSTPNNSLYPWSQRRLTLSASHPSPFPRYGHAANGVAGKEGDIYIMGGLIRSQTVRGDLWMVEGSGDRLDAYPVVTTSEGPGPRVGHASLLVGNAFIVFGGDTKLDEMDTLDETLYLLNTSTRQWSRASPHVVRPSGRYGHTLNILGSKLYIFGGQVDNLFFNDLVAFDLNTLQHVGSKWEVLVPVTEGSPDVPASRTNHTIITWNDKLYLFGGTNGTKWFNDVWSYDPRANQWSQLDCIGFIPQPREGHAAALVNDVMYIFGGRSDEGTDLGDLAAFRISSRRWYTFQNMGPSPSPRSGHSMTAVGSRIIVLGGEPSVPSRSPDELQLVYVLDTAKIRYPNDNPSQVSPTERSANRDPRRPGVQQMRSGSVSDGAGPGPDNRGPPRKGPRESIMGSSPPSTTPLGSNNSSASGNSRLPMASRTSIMAPSGPPPTTQAPTPRANGIAAGPRSKTPTGPGQKGKENITPVQTRDITPTMNGRRTPTTQRKDSRDGATAAATAAAAAVGVAAGAASASQPERSRSRQHQQQQPSIDSVTSPISPVQSADSSSTQPQTQLSSPPNQTQAQPPSPTQAQPPSPQVQSPAQPPQQQTVAASERAVRSPSPTKTVPNPPPSVTADATTSPTPRSTDPDLVGEVERLRHANEWYASELSLARRAGYTPQTSNSALLEDRGTEAMPENERPFIEAMLALKGELAKVQGEVETQSATAAKKIQEIERQRNVAIQEAVYAKAKLAGLGGNSRTPTPGDKSGSDMAAIDAEKMQDMSRKLAASLSAQAEMSAKLEMLTQENVAEKKARHLADETSSALQARVAELDEYRNHAASEIESLRAELLDAGKAFRDEAAAGSEAVTEVKLLRIDQSELTARLTETLQDNKNYQTSLEQLSKAMQATTNKSTTLERQLEEERLTKESLERKVAQVKSEYEEKVADLESVNRRLKDVEELMETYAEEAKAASATLAAGLQKVADRESSEVVASASEERVQVLQVQVETTKALLEKSRAQADETGQKLAEAMQRVAGLEFQQGQSSREAIALRRRLAEVTDEVRQLKNENAEHTQRLNDKQLEVDAIAMKHNALKAILDERSAQQSGPMDKRRSQILQSPSPQSGTATPEQMQRLRDLEQRLEDSLRAHRETKNTAEMQAQEIEKHFRDKLEQVENDYQSAVVYVKGTEKMLKRLKDELAKYKAQNTRLQLELEEVQRRSVDRARREETRSEAEADWEHERELLNKEIEDLRSKVRESATALDKQIRETKAQLDTLREERDQFKIKHSQMQLELMDTSQQVSEAKGIVEKLESENALLETRAQSAEQKVSMLLDQVENSVDAYRRSTLPGTNGDSIAPSARSSIYSGAPDNRTSMALDSLATELDALRSHWETTNKNYRLSTTFDFENQKTPTSPQAELPSNIAQWRQKLQQEEEAASRSGSRVEERTGSSNRIEHSRSPVSPVSPNRPKEFSPSQQNGSHAQISEATVAASGGVI